MRRIDTNSTDQSIRLWCCNSSGAAVTGLLHNSSGMSASVIARSAGRIVSTTALTLVPRTSVGVHRDNAFTEVSGGEYVIDLPDSFFTTAGQEISVTLSATALSGGYVLVESLEVMTPVGTAVDAVLTASHGSGSWQTATGFSTHSAADVWSVGVRTITGGSLTTSPPTASAIADAVWDEARAGHTTSGTFGFYLDAAVSGVGGSFTVDAAGSQLIVNALLAQGPTLYTALTTEENTLRVADEYVQQFRGLGDISGRSNIAFALKTRKTDADTAALIYLTETGGLTRVNGASYATTSNGSITVDDATAGNITVRLSSAVTASLTVGKRQDAVKILITGGNDITKRQGITNVIDATVDALAT